MVGADLPGSLQAVHARHLDVEYHHVGLVSAYEFDGFVSTAGFRHHLVALLLHDLLEIKADYGFVFGKHDFY